MLAVAAGGYACWQRGASPAPSRQGVALWLLAALTLVVGVWRGWTDAVALHGAVDIDRLQALHADHGSAWNTLRVRKAWLWCLLLAPLWARTGPRGGVWLARGMVAGLALVCAGVLWERALLVGLFDVDRVYRTTAWFWEMQVGGGAIDMEVWEVPAEHFGSFVDGIPSPLGIGKVRLADGSWVSGFVCEAAGLEGATDITHLGSWRAWLAAA